ncbi:MAG: hypothetical protein ACR2GA_00660 [Chloroflexota bacterium]
MAMNAEAVQTGMDVFDSTGDKVGSIEAIYALIPQDQSDSTPVNGTASSMFKVGEGGVLGVGAKQLYIPSTAVQTVSPGQSVSLNCTKTQAEAQYANTPPFVHDKR